MSEDGVHAAHCCKEHGCKYGNPECPVVNGEVKQDYPCEECNMVTKTKIQTHVELDVEDIARCCDHETGEKLIKEIDSSIADWDFTLAMAKWFISHLREEREAIGETFDIGELTDGN